MRYPRVELRSLALVAAPCGPGWSASPYLMVGKHGQACHSHWHPCRFGAQSSIGSGFGSFLLGSIAPPSCCFRLLSRARSSRTAPSEASARPLADHVPAPRSRLKKLCPATRTRLRGTGPSALAAVSPPLRLRLGPRSALAPLVMTAIAAQIAHNTAPTMASTASGGQPDAPAAATRAARPGRA